jgi:hypothetical protein
MIACPPEPELRAAKARGVEVRTKYAVSRKAASNEISLHPSMLALRIKPLIEFAFVAGASSLGQDSRSSIGQNLITQYQPFKDPCPLSSKPGRSSHALRAIHADGLKGMVS